MSTLLREAKAYLHVCDNLLNSSDCDISFVRVLCWNLYKTISSGLKHLIQEKGIECPKTHKINNLLELVSEYSNVSWFTGIQDKSYMITSWYTNFDCVTVNLSLFSIMQVYDNARLLVNWLTSKSYVSI